MNRYFCKEETQITEKHIKKRCSASLAIMKIQIKTTATLLYTLGFYIQKGSKCIGKDGGKQLPSYVAGGTGNHAAT